jgi:hypothetical protein
MNLTIISWCTGSLCARTSRPNDSQFAKPWNASTRLVIAAMLSRGCGSDRVMQQHDRAHRPTDVAQRPVAADHEPP